MQGLNGVSFSDAMGDSLVMQGMDEVSVSG